MKDNPDETKKNILTSAKKEFLKNGFVASSLRTIAANANVTTGALYRHFKDKDALFCSLVDNAVEKTFDAVEQSSVESHINMKEPLGKKHQESEKRTLQNFIAFLYSEFDAFTLLLTSAAGSSHETFLQDITNLYADKCTELVHWLKDTNQIKAEISDMSVHVISSSFITSMAELVFHKIPETEAVAFLENIHTFFHAGWIHLFGISCKTKNKTKIS